MSSPRLVLAAATAASFMLFLDTTVVNVASPRIGHDLGASVAGQQWVVDGYALPLAALLLTAGAVSDRRGARDAFLAGLAIFTLASLLCGLAPSLAVLVGARAFQGVGGALILPASLSLISHAFAPGAERSRALAIWGAVGGGVALSAGPVIGGLLTGAFGWRSVFLVNVPVGLVVLGLTARIGRGGAAPGRRPDVPGQIAGVVALTALTVLSIEGPNLGWLAPLPLAAGALFAAGAFAFVAIESRSAEPMLPLSLFRQREFTVSTIVGFAINFAFYGQLFFMSLFLQRRFGLSPAATGWRFVPEMVAAPVFTTLVSRFLPRVPPARALLGGVATCGVGLAAMALFGLRGDLAVDVPLLVLIGVGAGAPAFLVAVMLNAVPTARSGLAAGALNTGRQVGGLLGVALLGAVVGHSPSDAGVRLALALGAGAMLLSAALTATLRPVASTVDLAEAAAEAMA